MSDELLSEFKDGMSQAERLIPSLIPENIKIEDRDISDLLRFISELSVQVSYYNFNNQLEGSWEEFFKSDLNILIRLISRFDPIELIRSYERLRTIIRDAENDREAVAGLEGVFDLLQKIDVLLFSSLERFERISDRYPAARDFSAVLSGCKPEMSKLWLCNAIAGRLFGVGMKSYFTTPESAPEEPLADSEKEIFGESGEVSEQVLSAIRFIDGVLTALKSKFDHLAGIAAYYLKRHPLLEQSYEPHIGLLIAFLHLYTHLQEQINRFTGKHLDFYYRDILGIKPTSAIPDKVHVFFETDKNVDGLILKQGEELAAEIKGRQEPVIFKLQEDARISKAAIAALKTVFISDNPVFSAGNQEGDVRDAKVYCGDYPVQTPADFVKDRLKASSWPVLGEDQNELPAVERTMQEAPVGIIAGSPLLYLPGGEREISLTFYFVPATFQTFRSFIRNFAELSGKSEEAVMIELLSVAFKVEFTGPEKWQEVRDCRVRVPGDNRLEVILFLGPADPPVSSYRQAVHGGAYKNGMPLVRIWLNNGATHNAFAFFRDLQAERVCIRCSVKDFREVKLQNNIGNLSNTNPFQVFGPQPSTGAFLDMKNSNIFNRFTKDFSIRIEWLGLPSEDGGFEAYYEGYGARLDNNSFQVGISALSAGRFQPEAPAQQRFLLFQTDQASGSRLRLEDVTTISSVDFKKIEFLNDPLMEEEREVQETYFKEGAVRLMLLSPQEGFGHRLFQQVFPQTVMHNSKRFNKKLPLPNQPYIPVVKSISINYVLEHTEVLRESGAGDEQTPCITLAHSYPFGFDEIYPENDQYAYRFLPEFDHPCNLYIGIRDLAPGQELSLLFQFEERNYHHTVHEPAPVIWSYLYRNSWTDLNTTDLLSDSTNGFINSGIIRLKIPDTIGKENTILDPALFWLRASAAPVLSSLKSRVVAIYANAAIAERRLVQHTEGAAGFHLAPGSIKSFSRKVQGVQNVWQLFSSFDGKAEELKEHYYIRTSERLRHKQRPLTTQDIEQFILNEFPQILLAKCFGTGTSDDLILPGVNLEVVLIPREQDDGRFITEQPRVNLATLFRVKRFLSGFVSPFIEVEVGNPVYENVKVVCKVQFTTTSVADEGYYMRKLNEDIRQYMCPWLYESGPDLKIGTRIYISDMLNYIKNLSYVSLVTGFSLVHFYRVRDLETGRLDSALTDSAAGNIEFINGSCAEAVLIPSASHLITVLRNPEYEEPALSGIGSLSVGNELAEERRRQGPGRAGEGSPADGAPAEEYFRLIIHHHSE